MNYGISILFRAIPLAMAAFCFAYGACIFAAGEDALRLTAGPAVFFVGSVCVALYCTAATVIRQIVGNYTAAAKYILPAIGYCFALVTLVCGIFVLTSHGVGSYVTGHIVCGLALVAACISTTAAAATRFSLIPHNSADSGFQINPAGFSRNGVLILIATASVPAAAAWVWALILLARHATAAHTVAGSVMLGIACVCTSLIAWTASIAKQTRGTYTMQEKSRWMALPLVMGCVAFIFGAVMLFAYRHESIDVAAYVLFGLALICWSISSGVMLLAKTWHAEFALADRIAVIPVVMAIITLFMAAFLCEAVLSRPGFYVPSRLSMGFGALCFAFFAIVSVLECGTRRR